MTILDLPFFNFYVYISTKYAYKPYALSIYNILFQFMHSLEK